MPIYLGLKQRLATEELLEEEHENDVEMVTAEDENNIDHSKLSYIKIWNICNFNDIVII